MSDAIEFVVPGEAVPFARAGALGKMRFTPKKQRDNMGIIKHFAQQAMFGRAPIEGPIHLSVECDFLVPASWSGRKKASADYKSSKPDLDNLTKLIKDSLNTIVWLDDAQVASLYAIKRYRPIAQTRVRIQPIDSARPLPQQGGR